MIRSISTEVDMAALGPDPDPLKVLTIAANKVKMMPFSFLDTLADLACQTSPMKVKGRHLDDIGTLGKSSSSNKRPRAFSESWVGHSAGPWPTKTELTDMKKETLDGSALLPQMLDHYAEIYNKNGRIGIYTRQERDDIINRFREKKRRRVWKKKIRYHCRKNLADRRVRVKGRFVRRGSQAAGGTPSPSGDGSMEGEGDEDDMAEEDDSEGEDGGSADADATTTSSSVDGVESGFKRSRTVSASEKKAKKSRRVLFDESTVGNGPSTGSSPAASGSASASAVDADDTEGYSRMRRHSIAY